jgi:competence protein ComEA
MRDLLRFYFSMNRRERRGILILLFSLLILIFSYYPLEHFLENQNKYISVKYPSPGTEITVIQWQDYPERNNLKPNQNHSGFQKRNFAKRSYPGNYKNETRDSFNIRYTVKSFPAKTFNLNSADSSLLISIPGIGPALSARIIKYRNKLGGFSSPKQLYEVWGLDSSLVKQLIPFCNLDSGIKKMDLNKVTLEELKTHPYISFNLARLIVNYRKSHGAYRSVEDLRLLDLVDADLYAKLAPYFKVQE